MTLNDAAHFPDQLDVATRLSQALKGAGKETAARAAACLIGKRQ